VKKKNKNKKKNEKQKKGNKVAVVYWFVDFKGTGTEAFVFNASIQKKKSYHSFHGSSVVD
jgi:hypothetical protein